MRVTFKRCHILPKHSHTYTLTSMSSHTQCEKWRVSERKWETWSVFPCFYAIFMIASNTTLLTTQPIEMDLFSVDILPENSFYLPLALVISGWFILMLDTLDRSIFQPIKIGFATTAHKSHIGSLVKFNMLCNNHRSRPSYFLRYKMWASI